MTDLEKKYFQLYGVHRVIGGGWNKIAKLEDSDSKTMEKKYKKISTYVASKLEVSEENLVELKNKLSNELDEIDKLFKNQYSSNPARQKGFKTFEIFYEWYLKEKNCCYYCGISATNLKSLFDSKKIDSTKFNATLHIERLNPKEDYSPGNCRLACSLCNNAKSDLISKENYIRYFGEAMKNFLNDLSIGKIENITFQDVSSS